MESVVLRMALQAPNTPLVALRSILGIPTLQTRFDCDRVRLLLSIINTPQGSYVRQQLCDELELYDGIVVAEGDERLPAASGLWWHRTLQVLAVMDVAAAGDQSALPAGGGSWVDWARLVAAQWAGELRVSKETAAASRVAMLRVEARRRAREIQRCVASLGEVSELVDTPNLAPFVVDPKRDVTQLRIQLRGGRRTLFGHRHFHLDRCPWCTEQGMFTVPHLVRDCVIWEEERLEAWEKARAVAVAAGVDVAPHVAVLRHYWYHFTCGAAVPGEFLDLDLDRPTHFARGTAPATRHLRLALPVYQRMLGITGVFLRVLVSKTRELLEAGNPAWGYTPEVNARRVAADNHAAWELEEARAGEEDGGGDRLERALREAATAMETGDEARARAVLRQVFQDLEDAGEEEGTEEPAVEEDSEDGSV